MSRPHARSIRTSSSSNGIQSMPRSRSQARVAAMGDGQPATFSYAAMVIHAEFALMVSMMPGYASRGASIGTRWTAGVRSERGAEPVSWSSTVEIQSSSVVPARSAASCQRLRRSG